MTATTDGVLTEDRCSSELVTAPAGPGGAPAADDSPQAGGALTLAPLRRKVFGLKRLGKLVMRKFRLAALCAALGVMVAGGAHAAVVYQETGTLNPPSCDPFNNCHAGDFYVGGVSYHGFGAGDGQPAGSYHWELNVDPTLLDIQYVEVTSWDSWNEWWDGQNAGGQDSPFQNSFTYQVTETGIEGDFTVAPWTDTTRDTPAIINGVETTISIRRIDNYFTSVDIIGTVNGGYGAPYKFTITAIPEPATWAMMIAGFFGLGAMLRRDRRTASAVAVTA